MSDYKLLRLEPTAEMVSEGARHLQIMSLPEREAASVFRAMHAAAPAVQVEPVGWQYYQFGKWWNGDNLTRGQQKNIKEAGHPIRELYAAPQPSPDVAALVARLSKVIVDLESGFVACERCGDQEDTATLDCMPELTSIRNALAALAYRKGGEK